MDFLKLTKGLYADDDYIKTLGILEENINLAQENDMLEFNFLQGSILKDLAEETENTDVKFTYWLGSVGCFSRYSSSYSAAPLFNMAEHLGSESYYKKSMRKAKAGLDHVGTLGVEDSASVCNTKKELKRLIETAKSRIAVSKTRVGEQRGKESNENEETRKKGLEIDETVRSYWAGLNVEIKRNFMKVTTAELKTSVQQSSGGEGVKALEQVLTYARRNRKWRLWICRSCLKKFPNCDECTTHLEKEHAAECKPSSTKYMPERIREVWARKIWFGDWKPVDSEAAVEKIRDDPTKVKAFTYENGWSKGWPSAVDEERTRLLKDIKLLLVSFWDRKILSCSIRDRLKHFVGKQLDELQIPKDILTGLMETPQGLCFLQSRELNQVLAFVRKIKSERDDVTVLVCRAVESFCAGSRYKEKIGFDSEFSTLLLDRRLLRCKVSHFDEEGRISVFDPNVHYAKTPAEGYDFLSWLTDYSRDERFRFPTPIREHNLGIWMAVLRALQFTCRTLETKYAKKLQYQDRMSVKHENVNSIELLESYVEDKVALLDSKILQIENSRICLLESLTKLAAFDNRYYIHRPLRELLLARLHRQFEDNNNR